MTKRLLHTSVLIFGVWILSACASVAPAPAQELEAATAALQSARAQGAQKHATEQLQKAEEKFANGQRLIELEQNTAARRALQQATVDANLAAAMTAVQQRDAEQSDLQAQIDELQKRIEALQLVR